MMMNEDLESAFLQQVNQHPGITHKISRIYFEDVDEQKDVMQEMMYQLWRSFPHFDGRSKFSTWMYRVCLNTAFTYKRKNKEKRIESLSTAHQQVTDHHDGYPNNNKEEEITLLLKAIETLSALNKSIVLLYLENMSYEEIASVTGISRSNVSVRLVRIKKELEIQLKEKIKSINDVNT